ncbi:MAG: flagellar export chaperone FliS [Magnetococcales bacterium]|nr:flagellar export chaperone FliS [Magnetococcales bacterium]
MEQMEMMSQQSEPGVMAPPAMDEEPTPLEVLIQLYEGAIKFLGEASEACEDGRTDEFLPLLERGKRIIVAFQKTLDHEKGGQITARLNDLYTFMLDSLSQAELTHDVMYIDRVVEQLQVLLDGWQGAKQRIPAIS